MIKFYWFRLSFLLLLSSTKLLKASSLRGGEGSPPIVMTLRSLTQTQVPENSHTALATILIVNLCSRFGKLCNSCSKINLQKWKPNLLAQRSILQNQNLQKNLLSFWNLQLQQAEIPANFKHIFSDLVAMDSSLNLVSKYIIIVSFHFEFLFIITFFLNLIP